MLAIVHACALIGIEGIIVNVETDFNPRAQIPSFSIVGLPGSAVRESRERVRAAIKNSGLHFPNKVFVVNLSPADLPKQGPAYDLPIAVSVLCATDQLPVDAPQGALFIGELSLNGELRHVKGVMPLVRSAREAGIQEIFVPAVDAAEATLVRGVTVYPVQSLGELVEHFYGTKRIAPLPPQEHQLNQTASPNVVDFADVRGQSGVKRALEIAAAGGHNALLTGPPGAGKSLLARAMPGILPQLTLEEALEVTRIYSVADLLRSDQPLISSRPFRAPHHTISQAGLVGGGSVPRPGEISLAHRGVLFLDEIVEFPGRNLEVLRQPLEDHIVTISRAKGSLTFPANLLLIAARNPCPCGYFGERGHHCSCSPYAIERYQSRLSGPLLDRIDIHLGVQQVEYRELRGDRRAESSAAIRERVEAARARQRERLHDVPGTYCNADIPVGQIEEMCQLTEAAENLLNQAMRNPHMNLSARTYHRLLRLSRTIADLAGKDRIDQEEISEAISLRVPETEER